MARAADIARATDPVTGRGSSFWTARKVAWYRRALERSDYATTVLGALDGVLSQAGSVLDVGAGCGALALPLAERVPRVTALEPSAPMAQALRQEARQRGLAHLEVVEAAWGEAPVGPHDLVLCAHVGELLSPGSAFLREVTRVARRWVVLLRDAPMPGDRADKFFFGELYPRLLGREYAAAGRGDGTAGGLLEPEARATTQLVEYRSDQPFADLEDACAFWEEYLGVTGDEVRGFLREFLAARLRREGGGWVAPYRKRAAITCWHLDP